MRNKYSIHLLLLTLVLMAIPATAPTASAQIGFGISVGFAPPPLPVYEQPICPGDGYIWTPGYWAYDYDDEDYYWVPGTWVIAPRIGYLWTPGYWGWGGGGYVWHGGYWVNTSAFMAAWITASVTAVSATKADTGITIAFSTTPA